MPVQLNPVASTALVIFFVVASLVLLALLAVTAYLLWKLNGYLEEYRARLEPLLDKAETLVTQASDKVGSVGQQAERILAQGETTATVVQERVDQTSALLQRTINRPLIGFNSLWSGMNEGWSKFRQLQGESVGRTKE